MKKLLLLFLLSPMLSIAQDENYLIFEISTLTPQTSMVSKFEAAIGAHNKKYHPSGPYGVRVYSVESGRNTGKYMWVMGPTHWADLDTRPATDNGHDADWDNNVLPNLTTDANTMYLKFNSKKSSFPHDFNVSKLLVYYWDIVPNADWEKIDTLLGMVHNVYKTKLPDDTYGLYFNELGSTSEGKDITMVLFFDKYAWMGMDNGFNKKFEEVYGKDSWKKFLSDWNAQVKGFESEIWSYHEDLSGMSALVKAAERQ